MSGEGWALMATNADVEQSNKAADHSEFIILTWHLFRIIVIM